MEKPQVLGRILTCLVIDSPIIWKTVRIIHLIISDIQRNIAAEKLVQCNDRGYHCQRDLAEISLLLGSPLLLCILVLCDIIDYDITQAYTHGLAQKRKKDARIYFCLQMLPVCFMMFQVRH